MPQIDLGAIVSYAIGALFVVFWIYLMWLAAREWAFTYWLTSYGSVTQAQIIERSAIGSSKGGGTHSVKFRFALLSENGETEYIGEQQVSRRHFNRLKEESYVHIIYIPHNPYLVRLWGDDEDNTLRDTASIFIIIFAPVFIFLLLTTLLLLHRYFLASPRKRFVS